MNTQPTPPAAPRQHPLLIAAALAVILFCAVGTAAIMGWLPASKSETRGQLSDADRVALAAGLQQPGQPGLAANPAPQALQPTPQALQPTPQALQPALGMPAQGFAAAPASGVAAPVAPGYAVPQPGTQYAAPAMAAGTAAYGASGSQGTTASGHTPAPAEPVRDVEASKPARVADSGGESRWCGSCGNVESIRQITTRARGSGVGAAGGAVLGGLLGNQIGGGHGRQLATVAGAVGGAVMGNQVEGNMKATHSYEIRVRLDDGTLRTFHQHSAPQWRNGDRVRIVKGSLRSA